MESRCLEPQLVDTAAGLDDDNSVSPVNHTKRKRPSMSVRINSKPEVHIVERYRDNSAQAGHPRRSPSTAKRRRQSPPDTSERASPLPDFRKTLAQRLGIMTLLVAVLIPLLQSTSLFAYSTPVPAVNGGVIPQDAAVRTVIDLSKRDDSPIDACVRWAQQSAIVNATLYLYGGQASTTTGQKQNTWNNNFLTLDLSKTWNIASPSLTGLPQPSGPPPVSLGYLWNSYESLYLYGGEFSWQPAVSPTAFSTWEYSIASQEWIEHSNPLTSAGSGAPSNQDPVQRAAEGAGVSIPSLGRGFYFGGHLDGYTTEGWSQWIPRVYLQSLLEFTFPGFGNDQVDALGDGKTAGTDGDYRNITQGGLQSAAGFTERADGLLIYVPGFGNDGILLALAGGTSDTFTQMNVIDVYDISTSSWYRQSTSGPTPKLRVNPCAVLAAAPDGSSYNLYMFGGQNLQPAGDQIQYDDMWILTIPSFTWIEVDQTKQSVPYGRSGATCNIWDGQMIMIGGFVGDQLSCDSPGIYVYDLSSLQWVQNFTAVSLDAGVSASQNPFNQQPAQLTEGHKAGGLEGSYGYQVPDAVISVVGGDKTGHATVTTPVVEVTAGPLASGKPQTYTVTGADGSVETGTTNGRGGTTGSTGKSKDGPNIAAIVVGVIAGILFFVVCYLAFCAYIYRKQVALWKRHATLSQQQTNGEKVSAWPMLLAEESNSDRRRNYWSSPFKNSTDQSTSQSGSGNAGSGAFHVGDWSENNSIRPDNSYHAMPQSDSRRDSVEELLNGQEPTFVGVLLNPRRSLRVVNKD